MFAISKFCLKEKIRFALDNTIKRNGMAPTGLLEMP